MVFLEGAVLESSDQIAKENRGRPDAVDPDLRKRVTLDLDAIASSEYAVVAGALKSRLYPEIVLGIDR